MGIQLAISFDVFVINNQVRAKAVALKFGGRTHASASLQIDAIELIRGIPPNEEFGYTITRAKDNFGQNGKILNNLESFFSLPPFVAFFYNNLSTMDQLAGKRNTQKLAAVTEAINAQPGNTAAVVAWAEANAVPSFELVEPLKLLADGVTPLLHGAARLNIFLCVLQVSDLYVEDKDKFKRACRRILYEADRDAYIESFRAFNSTWKNIRPKEKDGNLLIEFPKAHQISNGQRDILSFVALLEQARRKFKKDNAILIIDEVFDYLDDANIVAAQYYITQIIEEYRSKGKELYPLILTHLNPVYFNTFTFSKQKIYYLDTRTAMVTNALRQLIIHREDPTIANDVSRHLLHYDPGQINKRAEFRALGLRETWGEANHFDTFIRQEIQKYLTDQPGFDPFAVCCAVRRQIENRVYNNIADPGQRSHFLTVFKTKDKLAYAESIGVNVPEFYYLLGLIYNDGLHWKHGTDNESPLIAKLENGTIRNLISFVFS